MRPLSGPFPVCVPFPVPVPKTTQNMSEPKESSCVLFLAWRLTLMCFLFDCCTQRRCLFDKTIRCDLVHKPDDNELAIQESV